MATTTSAGDIMEAFEKELSKISGLHSLKAQLRRWVKQLVVDQTRRDMGLRVGDRRAPHMAFLGNPGTGKTMVARNLGKLLHVIGTLPTDKVVEVQRTDLVARYVGQTGPKTRKVVHQVGGGGILFVDEAYRLMPQDGSASDFGLEALEEIMSFMDTKQVIVIFAGYRKQMDNVISANDGFRRRVTKFFYFEDFTCLDLANILVLKMSHASRDDPTSPLYGFKLHPLCTVETIAETIERESTKKQRGEMNGGLVDTMLMSARESLDDRLDDQCRDVDSLITITMKDLTVGLRLMSQSCTDDKNPEVIVNKEEVTKSVTMIRREAEDADDDNEVMTRKKQEDADEITDEKMRKKQLEDAEKATTKQGPYKMDGEKAIKDIRSTTQSKPDIDKVYTTVVQPISKNNNTLFGIGRFGKLYSKKAGNSSSSQTVQYQRFIDEMEAKIERLQKEIDARLRAEIHAEMRAQMATFMANIG